MPGRMLVVLILAGAGVLSAAERSHPVILEPGTTVAGTLPFGDPQELSVAFVLTADTAGPITLEARSLEFWPVLSVVRRGEDTAKPDHSESGGAGTNSRLVIAAEKGESYRIDVRAKFHPFCGGRFQIEARKGEFEPVDPKATKALDREFWDDVDERAVEIGSAECRVRGMSWRAGWLTGLSDYDEALVMARQAVDMADEKLGPDHLLTSLSVNALATAHQEKGELAEAVPLFERALAIREKHLGPHHLLVSESVNNLAIAHALQGEFAGARPYFERSLRSYEAIKGPDHPDVALIQNNLGWLLWRMGHYDEARARHERALAIQRKNFGPEHPSVAQTMNNLAVVLENMGLYAEARPIQEEAQAMRERLLGPEHPYVAVDLSNLSVLLKRMGLYPEARPLIERALAIRMATVGPEHHNTLRMMNNLAELDREMGNFASARRLHEEVLAIRKKELGPDHADVAQSLMNLAALQRTMGDFEAVQSSLERALEIYEAAFGADHVNVADTLTNLAFLEQARGTFEKARPLLARALAIREKALGEDHSRVAESKFNLAGNLRALGDPVVARSLYGQALTVQEKVLGRDSPQVAVVLDGIAGLEYEEGNFEAARAACDRSLAIRQSALGNDHPLTATSLLNLGAVLQRLGRLNEALEAALDAERIGSDHLRLTSRGLAESLALHYARVRATGLDLALTILEENPAQRAVSGEAAWEAVMGARALVLDEMTSRVRALVSVDDAATKDLQARFAATSTRLANLMVRGPEDLTPEKYATLLRDARSEHRRAGEVLAEASLAFRDEQERSSPRLSAVEDKLPPGSALIAYVVYESGMTRLGVGGVPSYAAFVLRQGAAARAFVPLGPVEDIEALVRDWKSEFAQGNPGTDEAESRYRRAGEALRRAIWDPLAGALGGSGMVFVVPDGSLNLVAMAALPVAGSKYLVEDGPLVHYLSAERDLLVPPGSPGQETRLLAIGDPAFNEPKVFASLRHGDTAQGGTDARPPVTGAVPGAVAFRGNPAECPDFDRLRFDRLPGTAAETEDIMAIVEARSGATGKPAGATRLTGAAATESAFKESAPGARFLHVATHGFFLGGQCPSALSDSLRGIGGLVPAEGDASERPSEPGRRDPAAIGENPLVLAGLALAGANHRSAAGAEENDGIITAEEISTLDLSGTEWAVLSACDTGVGEVETGEGVLGLRRAFRVAGARTLIMSLWSVEDRSTHRFMRALYEARLGRGLGVPESMREASLAVLQERRAAGHGGHPASWGAFVAAGEWR